MVNEAEARWVEFDDARQDVSYHAVLLHKPYE